MAFSDFKKGKGKFQGKGRPDEEMNNRDFKGKGKPQFQGKGKGGFKGNMKNAKKKYSK